jgi:hypothetical protein
VCLLGELVSSFGALQHERQAALQRAELLGAELTTPLVRKLLQHAVELRPLVKRDGKGVTELEFVLGMMMEQGVVDWQQMKPFIQQFRYFDVHGCGRVGEADVDALRQETADERQARLAAIQKGLQGGKEMCVGDGVLPGPDQKRKLRI